MAVYVITTGRRGFDWEVDQVCESERDAKREAAQLRAWCDNVKIHAFDTWPEANAFCDIVDAD